MIQKPLIDGIHLIAKVAGETGAATGGSAGYAFQQFASNLNAMLDAELAPRAHIDPAGLATPTKTKEENPDDAQ